MVSDGDTEVMLWRWRGHRGVFLEVVGHRDVAPAVVGHRDIALEVTRTQVLLWR